MKPKKSVLFFVMSALIFSSFLSSGVLSIAVSGSPDDISIHKENIGNEFYMNVNLFEDSESTIFYHYKSNFTVGERDINRSVKRNISHPGDGYMKVVQDEAVPDIGNHTLSFSFSSISSEEGMSAISTSLRSDATIEVYENNPTHQTINESYSYSWEEDGYSPWGEEAFFKEEKSKAPTEDESSQYDYSLWYIIALLALVFSIFLFHRKKTG